MKSNCGRCDVLEIAEHSSGSEYFEDLAIQASLTLVRQVMDGEAGDDAIKVSHFG